MKRVCAAALILAAAVSAFAHHSITVDYDSSRTTTLTGKVTKVDWRNPHAFLYVDAKGANWAIELGSVSSLIRMGWTKNSMKIGQGVVVQGILAIDGRKMINARRVSLPDSAQTFVTWEGKTANEK